MLENSWVSASPSASPAPSLPAPLVPRHPRLQGQGSCGIRSVSLSLCLSLTFPPALSLCVSRPQPGCGELPLDSQVPGQLRLLGMGGVSVLSGVIARTWVQWKDKAGCTFLGSGSQGRASEPLGTGKSQLLVASNEDVIICL